MRLLKPVRTEGIKLVVHCVLKIVSLSVLLGGVAEAKIKVDPAQSATFHLSKGYQKSKMLGGNTQLFFMAREAKSCKGIKYIVGFNWSDKSDVIKAKPLPAGRPLTIYALAKINSDGGYNQVIEGRCARTVTFTPKIGGNYIILQKIDLKVPCDVQIVDQATGQSPPDIVQSEGPICGGYI